MRMRIKEALLAQSTARQAHPAAMLHVEALASVFENETALVLGTRESI